MPSESNGNKPDSQEPGPVSGQDARTSARAPSAWGAARDALASVRNLDALLRSSTVPYATIRELLPELRAGADGLRDMFDRSRMAEPATASVAEYGLGRAEDLAALLGMIDGSNDREELARSARALADDLEASTALLALLERAAAPGLTEVGVDLVATETARASSGARGRELSVRFDQADPDCIVATDPNVVGPLLALVVTCVASAGVADIVLRVQCTPPTARLVVEPAAPGDAGLPALRMRVMSRIPPTEQAARRVAERIGATLELVAGRGSIALAYAAG